MVKMNKYLRELGLKESDYPFTNVEGDDRYIEDEEGFRDCEFFSLDYSLSLYIYSQLCYFRENCLYGYPCGMTEEKWKSILDKMIEAFKLMIVEDQSFYQSMHLNIGERNIISKNRQKKINHGLRLFIKYYNNLWY